MKRQIRAKINQKTNEEKINGKGKVIPVLSEFKHYAMKVYGGVDV
jgi:hypothetical protein